MMKLANRLFWMCLLLFNVSAHAQSGAASAMPATPTTKILAIGRLAAPPTPEQMKLLAAHEVPETLRLYLAGKIDQWYSIQDGAGVVFILNLSSVEEASAMLEKLPLGQAKLMTFQLIPLGPLRPLATLLPAPDKKQP